MRGSSAVALQEFEAGQHRLVEALPAVALACQEGAQSAAALLAGCLALRVSDNPLKLQGSSTSSVHQCISFPKVVGQQSRLKA